MGGRHCPGVDCQHLAPCCQTRPALSTPLGQVAAIGPYPTHQHTLAGRWEHVQAGLLVFWLNLNTGWRFSLQNWWQSQRRKSSCLLHDLEKPNLSTEVSSSVERFCETLHEWVCEWERPRCKAAIATGPLNLGAEPSALYDGRKVRWFFSEVISLFVINLSKRKPNWVKENLKMTYIGCTIRRKDGSHALCGFFFFCISFIVSVPALEKLVLHTCLWRLHSFCRLPSKNHGSDVLLQLLLLWRFLILEKACNYGREQRE